jgi:hypothetical protein
MAISGDYHGLGGVGAKARGSPCSCWVRPLGEVTRRRIGWRLMCACISALCSRPCQVGLQWHISLLEVLFELRVLFSEVKNLGPIFGGCTWQWWLPSISTTTMVFFHRYLPRGIVLKKLFGVEVSSPLDCESLARKRDDCWLQSLKITNRSPWSIVAGGMSFHRWY